MQGQKIQTGYMTSLMLLLLIAAIVVLAPWLGVDSRPTDPDRRWPDHPLAADTGENCS